jgi:hypothetical protein
MILRDMQSRLTVNVSVYVGVYTFCASRNRVFIGLVFSFHAGRPHSLIRGIRSHNRFPSFRRVAIRFRIDDAVLSQQDIGFEFPRKGERRFLVGASPDGFPLAGFIEILDVIRSRAVFLAAPFVD